MEQESSCLGEGKKGDFQNIRNAGINGEQRVWMHCASLGEFEQGRPVIESLRKIYPGHHGDHQFFFTIRI